MSPLHRRLALVGTVVALVGVAAPATALARHGDDDPVGHVRHSGDDAPGHVRHSSSSSARSTAAKAATSATHIRRSRGLDDAPGHLRRSRGADDGVGASSRTSSDDGDDRRGRGRSGRS